MCIHILIPKINNNLKYFISHILSKMLNVFSPSCAHLLFRILDLLKIQLMNVNWSLLWPYIQGFGNFKFQMNNFEITCCLVHLGQLVVISNTKLPFIITCHSWLRLWEVQVQDWLLELTDRRKSGTSWNKLATARFICRWNTLIRRLTIKNYGQLEVEEIIVVGRLFSENI